LGKNEAAKFGSSQVRRYYARTFSNSKEIWEGLRTTHFSVAKARLTEFLREQRDFARIWFRKRTDRHTAFIYFPSVCFRFILSASA